MTFTDLLDAYLEARMWHINVPRHKGIKTKMDEAALRLNAAVPLADWSAVIEEPTVNDVVAMGLVDPR